MMTPGARTGTWEDPMRGAAAGRAVLCEGHTVHAGGRVATAEGRVAEGAGRRYAHATRTRLVMRPGAW